MSKKVADLIQDADDAFADMRRETWDRDKPMPTPLVKATEKMLRVLEAIKDQPSSDPVILPEGGNWFSDAGAGDFAGKSPGQAFAESSALDAYVKAGIPRGPSSKASVPSFLEAKALPTLGSGSIQASRDADVVRSAGLDRLRLVDVIPKVPTNSNAVEFLKVTSSEPQVAAGVAEGAAKPESSLAIETASASVRTIAAWLPVTEQMLSDLPQIRQLIDSELLHDIARFVEYQMLWGAGTGQDLLGFMNTSGVNAGRTEAGDTLVDKVRRAVTDINADGGEADTLVVHPQDLEDLLLTKGTDNHYLNQTFPTVAGPLRVWGLRVVESMAAEAYRSTNTTDQRVMLILDARRAATIYQRQASTVEVGYVNDDFTKNRRTIRAEERLAFAVRRPFVVKYIETVAAVL